MRGRWGDAPALAVARAAEEAVGGGSAEFCDGRGSRRLVPPGRLPAGLDRAAHDGVWARRARGLPGARRAGDELRALDADEVPARCASPAFRAGAIYPSVATVQPARLALGLRERLLGARRRAVRVLAGAGAARRRRRGRGAHRRRHACAPARRCWRSAAPPGAGAARCASRLTVASSHIVITEPVPDLLEEIGWTGGECITDSRALRRLLPHHPGRAHRLRLGRRADRDGGPAGRPLRARPRGRRRAAEHLHAYFPGLAGAASPTPGAARSTPRRPTCRWSCRSRGGRAFAAAGYTGNGVGPSHMVGRTLASLALDRRDEPSRLAFVDPSPPRVPPEPFHWIGGEAIRAGIIAKEEAELRAAAPAASPQQSRRVPELIGFHIGR